jgi:hypothetical protein
MSNPNFIQVGFDTAGINTKLSTNGIDWLDSSNNQFTEFGNSVGYGTNNTTPQVGSHRWVMVGLDLYDPSSSNFNTIKYTDYQGLTWNDASSNQFTGVYGQGNDIQFGKTLFGNNLWVAVGGDSSSNTIKYSYDGSSWLNANNSFYGLDNSGTGFAVSYGEDNNGVPLWVAGGRDISNNTIKYSFNGIDWNNSNNGTFGGGFCEGVTYGFTASKNVWVATGNNFSGGNNIKYSYDGINWNNANTIIDGIGLDVTWGINNNHEYIGVCVGLANSGSTILYSYDGINWNDANNGFESGDAAAGVSVTWGTDSSNNNIYIAGGYNSTNTITTKYSYNAIDWFDTSNNTINENVAGIGSSKSIIFNRNGIEIVRTFYQLLPNGNIINEAGDSSTVISLKNQYTTYYDDYTITGLPTFQLFNGEATSYTPTLENDTNIITTEPYDLSVSNVDFIWTGNPNYGVSKFLFTMSTADEGPLYNYYTGEVTVYLVAIKENGCYTGEGPYPPRLWSRGEGDCPDLSGATMPDGEQMTFEDLSEKRKATIFQYKKNSAGFSKKQNYSRLARGIGKPRGASFATQSATYTNPNIRQLKSDGMGTLICPNTRRNWAFTSQNDTPGPLRRITNYPTVPLYNYIPRRTYLAGGTKWPQYGPYNPNTPPG